MNEWSSKSRESEDEIWDIIKFDKMGLEEKFKLDFSVLENHYLQAKWIRYLPIARSKNFKGEDVFWYSIWPKFIPQLLCSPNELLEIWFGENMARNKFIYDYTY